MTEEIKKEIELSLKVIEEIDGVEIARRIKKEIREALELNDFYISACGTYSIRQAAPFHYFDLLIEQLTAKGYKTIEAGLHYSYESKRFSIDWIEEDLIISLKPQLHEDKFEDRYFTIHTLKGQEIGEHVPLDFELWNIKPIKKDDKFYIIAINKNNIEDYHIININDCEAWEITEKEYYTALTHQRASSPEQLKEHLFGQDRYYKNHAILFKPVIERLYNIKINKL